MTNLTEKWKKGELKRGMYWVVVDADGDRSIQPCVYGSEFDDFEEVADKDLSFITAGNINQREHYSICWEEVLAPVPSYEEWQELKEFADYSLHNRDELTRQINFWMDKHTQIEKENMQLRQFCEEFNALNVAEENQKLKELLEECNLLLIKQQANDEVEHKESAELVLRIEEVLK